jgi:hypothetical protein
MTFEHQDKLKNSPYFDDFDTQKNFLQILFKPGVAVQARELTQLQTLLQNQISKISDHIFKDGSKIFGADLSIGGYFFLRVKKNTIKNSLDAQITDDFTVLQTAVNYFKNKSFAPIVFTYDSIVYGESSPSAVQTSREFLGDSAVKILASTSVSNKVVLDNNLDFQIEVIQVLPETATDNLILIFKFTKGSLINIKSLTNIKLYEITTSNYANLYSIPVVNNNLNPINFEIAAQVTQGSDILLENVNTVAVATITPGIFYKDGRFINTIDSTAILYKTSSISGGLLDIESTMLTDNKVNSSGKEDYSGRKLFSYPTKRLGFDISTEIVDYQMDSTLLDNSIGSYNEKAPGADRLKINFEFTQKEISTNEVDNYNSDTFVEVGRTKKGIADYIKKTPDYADILKLFAQRTYDESGSYTVRPFLLDFKEHLRNDTFTLISSSTSFTNIPEVGDIVTRQYLSGGSSVASIRLTNLIFPSETKTGSKVYPTEITNEPIGLVEKVIYNYNNSIPPKVAVVVKQLNDISFSTLTGSIEMAVKSADDGVFRSMMVLDTTVFSVFNLDTEGVYSIDSTPEGDENKFVAKVSSGKAYVEGFAYENTLPQNVTFDKARGAEHISLGDSTLQGKLNNILYLSPAVDTVFGADIKTLGNVLKENIEIRAAEDIVSVAFTGTPTDAFAQGTVQSWSPFKDGNLINLNTLGSTLNINNKESVIFVSGQAPGQA